MGFLNDLRRGEAAEKKVRKLCLDAKKTIVDATDRSYDFLLEGEKIEIKRDDMEARTGNVAIELWNTKKDLPSGPLYNSDKVIYVFKDEIRITTPNRISELLKEPHRIVKNAGDGNATIALFPRAKFNEYSDNLEDFLNN